MSKGLLISHLASCMEYLAQGEITTTRKFFSVGDIFCKHGSLIVDFVIKVL